MLQSIQRGYGGGHFGLWLLALRAGNAIVLFRWRKSWSQGVPVGTTGIDTAEFKRGILPSANGTNPKKMVDDRHQDVANAAEGCFSRKGPFKPVVIDSRYS